MTIQSFDRTNLKLLRADIDAALQAVAQKHGITLKAGNVTFSPENCSFKLEGSIVRNGEVQSREVVDFKRYAQYVGLDAEDFGKEFTLGGIIYRISGLKPSTKRPVIATSLHNGKQYLWTIEAVRKFLNKSSSN